MSDNKPTPTALIPFLAEIKSTQTLWALKDSASDDWVVLDSPTFENTDVMPLWSNAELAQQHCIEEWQNYVPSEISVAEWFEFWLEDLNEDNVIVGINWQEEDDCLEMELSEFTLALSEVESLK